MSAPTPRQLILNLMLAADGHTLSARAAVASCALFGIRENSARVALARLAATGLVEAAERGSYSLGAEGAALATEVGAWRSAEQRVRPWGGGWVAVHVANLGRSDRPALRARSRALSLLGLRELTRGLYFRPDNLSGGVADVYARLCKLGLEPDALAFHASQLSPDQERAAQKLWDGKALSKGYRQTREKLERWMARADELELPAAARESFLLGDAAIRRLVFDPLLPEPLVDVAERRAFLAVVRRFDAVGRGYWQHFLNDTASEASHAQPIH